VTTSTGAEVVADVLAAHGVSAVFSLPGVQLDSLHAALTARAPSIRLINARHEQGAAFMAFGYAQASGELGVLMVVPGPGLLNAGTALATAWACNTPLLCIVGQADSRLADRGWGAHHEVPRQREMIGHVCKWSRTVTDAREIAPLLLEAIHEAHAGRPRPVLLELPVDIAATAVETDVRAAAPKEGVASKPDAVLVAAASALLREAKRPLIIAGGGCANAPDQVRALAHALGAPVMMTTNGRGTLNDDDPLAMGSLEGHVLWGNADVVLALGTRMFWPLAIWKHRAAGMRLVRVDIDAEQIGKPVASELAIVADVAPTVMALLEGCGRDAPPSETWPREELRSLRRRVAEQIAGLHPQADYCAVLERELPAGAVVVADSTQLGYYATTALPIRRPRELVTAGFQGTLGFALPAALGARFANPSREVLAIIGDGGFQFCVSELATARQYGVKVIVVLVNDCAYGEVVRLQTERFGYALPGATLLNPDFSALVASFGLSASLVTTPDELTNALREALRSDVTSVIEVRADAMPSLWNLMPPAHVTERRTEEPGRRSLFGSRSIAAGRP